MSVHITVELGPVEARLAAAASPTVLDSAVAAATRVVQEIAVKAVAARTPRVSGELAASTAGSARVEGATAVIAIQQSAKSKPNLDGSGGGVPYAQFVIGGRGAIVAPSAGPFSTGKRALRTPFGLRKSVGPSQSNPYPADALEQARGEMEAAAHEAVLAALRVEL